jgi:hypothetical protein
LAGNWVVSRSQRRQSREERAEDRAKERHETRQTAYLKFLYQVDATTKALDILWDQLTGKRPGPASFDPLKEELNRLDSLSNLVVLAGPEEVGHIAKNVLLSSLLKEVIAAQKMLSGDDAARMDILDIIIESSIDRREVREQFTKAAGTVLGSNLDPIAPID